MALEEPRPRDRIVLSLILPAVFLLAVFPVSDFDAWTHLAFGRHMVEGRSFVSEEIFVYPALGSPISNSSWLFQVPLYLSYKAGGLTGVILFRAGIIALVFLVFARLLREIGLRSPALIFLFSLATVLLTRFRFAERPEVFTYLFFVFFLLAFMRVRRHPGTRLLYLLPLVQMVWSNSHPGASLGVLLSVVFLGGQVAEKYLLRVKVPSGAEVNIAKVAAISALVVIAFFVNPLSFSGFLSPVTLGTSVEITQSVQEMQPVTLSLTYLLPYLALLLFALAGIILNRKSIPVAWIVLFVIFAFVSFRVVRSLPLFFFIAVPLMALLFSGREKEDSPFKKLFPVAAALGLAGVLLFAGIHGTYRFGFGEEQRLFPRGATEFLKKEDLDRNRIFNYFGWGGYVSWSLGEGRAFIDGRYVAGELSDEYDHIMAASPKWKGLLDKHRIDVILINSIGITDGITYPLIHALEKDPGWRPVYADASGLIYLRRGTSAHLPEVPPERVLAGRTAEAEFLLSYGVRGEIEKTLAGLYLRKKDYGNAKIFYSRWLEKNPGDAYSRGMYEFLGQKGY